MLPSLDVSVYSGSHGPFQDIHPSTILTVETVTESTHHSYTASPSILGPFENHLRPTSLWVISIMAKGPGMTGKAGVRRGYGVVASCLLLQAILFFLVRHIDSVLPILSVRRVYCGD